LLAAAIALGTAHPAASQGVLVQRNQAIQPLAPQVDSSTLQRLTSIQTSYDRRIAAAFDRNPALRDRMKAELEAIAAERDPARKRQLITSYQQTFGSQYQQVLQTGRVDLSAMAREMKAAAPQFDFTLTGRMGITARPLASTATTQSTSRTLAARTATAGTLGSAGSATGERRERLALRQFEFDSRGSCRGTAGNEAIPRNDGLQVASNAAVMAGCDAAASYVYRIVVPAGEVGELNTRATLVTESFALGVLGFSTGEAVAELFLVNIADNGVLLDFPDFRPASVKASSFAPFLASDADFANTDIGARTVFLPAGKYNMVLRGNSRSQAAGIVAGTNASSWIKDFSATITYRPAP